MNKKNNQAKKKEKKKKKRKKTKAKKRQSAGVREEINRGRQQRRISGRSSSLVNSLLIKTIMDL